jgi:hypothetical protein
VIAPVLPLLRRVKRPGQKAPVIFLSVMGWRVFQELGLLGRGSKNGDQ